MPHDFTDKLITILFWALIYVRMTIRKCLIDRLAEITLYHTLLVFLNQPLSCYYFFCPEMSTFTSAAYIQVHFRLDHPREQSDLGPYCLQYSRPLVKSA